MISTTRSTSTTSPKDPNANADGPAPPVFPLDFGDRRLLILDLNRDGERQLGGNKNRSSAVRRLIEEAGRMGFGLDDMALLHCELPIAYFSWPRNVKWKDLPVVTEPQYRHFYSSPGFISETSCGWFVDRMPMADAVPSLLTSGCEIVVISSPDLDMRVLYEVDTLIRVEERNAKIAHFDGHALNIIDEATILAARDRYYAEDRFVYNHALNLSVIGGRAYLKVAREHGYSQRMTEARMPGLRDYYWEFGHPLCIQLMYELSQRVRIPDIEFSDASEQEDWIWANGLDQFTVKQEGYLFSWEGTGRYPVWTERLGRIPEIEPVRRGASRYDTILRWIKQLDRAGFVGLHENRISLTSEGRGYLDLIGTSLLDPDVLLRWRGENGAMCSPADIRSADRWLNRNFRKLKRNVAGLPASPIHEEGEKKWPELSETRFLVRGIWVNASTEFPAEVDFSEIVQEIELTQRESTLGETEAGVVRQEDEFGEPGHVRGVWVGVPLAAFENWYREIADYEFLADWTKIDAKIAEMPLFRRLRPFSKEIRTLSVTGVTKEAAVYRVTPVLMEMNERCHQIIYGRVLRLNLSSECDQDLKTVVRWQCMGLDRKDGIKVFGEGDLKTVSIGVLVGAFDPETGQRVIGRDFCAARGGILRPMRKIESTQIIHDHPDLSALGYWSIAPDGSVLEVTPANVMRDTS